jgi:hypothetical protein
MNPPIAAGRTNTPGVSNMKYALFIYEDESFYGPGKAGPQVREMISRHVRFNQELGAARIGGAGLTAATAATTVRTSKGHQRVYAVPASAETSEPLSGFYLIEAPDLDAAISIAKRVPVLQDGAIEIRPMLGP